MYAVFRRGASFGTFCFVAVSRGKQAEGGPCQAVALETPDRELVHAWSGARLESEAQNNPVWTARGLCFILIRHIRPLS